MPRPLRIEYPGAWYHVFSMAARRRPVFKTEAHRDLFLEVVQQTAETYGVEVHAYCVVPDQYHLLIRTPRANLSRTMRQLNGVFTQRCNKQFGGKGQLFRGRYKAVLIDDATYLGATARHIHYVPVVTEQAARPDQYQWSSCRAQVGGIKGPAWLNTKALAKVNGVTYTKFLAQGVDDETQHFYSRKHIEAVRGDTAFRKAAKASVKGTSKKGGTPNGNVPALPEIYKQIALAFKVKPEHLQLSFRGRSQGNLPRQVAMALARSPGGYSLMAIAKSLKVGHYSSVSVAAARLKKKLETDEPLQRKVDRLKTQLFKV